MTDADRQRTRGEVSERTSEQATEGHAVPRLARAGAAVRRLAIDVTPLRRSPDFRRLWFGQLIGQTGRQITAVALPIQVFLLTRSSIAVGAIGLAQVVPLIVSSIGGGPIVDRIDRRLLILATELGLGVSSAMLLAGALMGDPPLWYVYAAAGLAAGLSGINVPAKTASVPNLVGKDELPAAMALSQVLYNVTMIVGPAIAGEVIDRAGLEWAYGADVITVAASLTAVLMLRPLPPAPGESDATGWQAIREGLRYLRGRRVLLSTFVIDLDAMIFGMPRALFPVLGLTVFHVNSRGVGWLYAAPAVGALVGALTTGWVGRIRRQGLAVVIAVVVWGAAITAFGLSRLFALALFFLAVAGAADVISAVFRGTILQSSVPDHLRGRVSGVHIMVVTGGPRLGDAEAGLVAGLVSPSFSVVSGGVACIVGAALLAARVPELSAYRTDAHRGRP